jgi:hypothetical protein
MLPAAASGANYGIITKEAGIVTKRWSLAMPIAPERCLRAHLYCQASATSYPANRGYMFTLPHTLDVLHDRNIRFRKLLCQVEECGVRPNKRNLGVKGSCV